MTLEDAGILEVGGEKLTAGAKYKFIEDVREAMRLGSNWEPPLFKPCGPEIPPIPANFPVPNLHDEQAFSAWHTNVLSNYYSIAKALNVQGQTPFFPIVFDAIALATQLGINIPSIKFSEYPSLMLNVPALLAKLQLLPIDLPTITTKLAGLGIPPSPFPPELPIPKLKIPNLPVEMLPDLFKMFEAMLKMPFQIPKLLTPTAILPLLTLDFSALCGSILKVLPSPNGPNPLLQIASYKVLAVKMVECIAIDAIGLTLGSSSGGAVGGLGKEFGYEVPPLEANETPIRDKIVNAAMKLNNLSYSNDKETYTIALFPDLTFKNDNSYGDLGERLDKDDDGTSGKAGMPKKRALLFAKTASSCGLFVRACLIAAGATSDKYFDEPYVPGTVISGLMSVARKRNAIIFDRTTGDKTIPAFKRGDFVIVGTDDAGEFPFHVQMFLEDYDGGYSGGVGGICGGAPDIGNKNPDGGYYPTKITDGTYQFKQKTAGGFYSFPFAGPDETTLRPIVAIIDSEKIIGS
jgi:hypothetical protein